ncbi:DUF134 domain-containing protein [Candidatus Woesebacteria bacterium]|nr:DUF134 domain-containing protein [Candidatus Woesebacteria bacterium]
MPRPRKPRCLRFRPGVNFFKPVGIPLRQLDEVVLEHDEIEALKLHDVDGLDQIGAAKKMKVSQPTFGRILDSAYKKIANALIKGKAIRIEER